MMSPSNYPRIPYGVADFQKIQKENAYYVDKTSFLHAVEQVGDFLFFIRPRRFGKSLWLSVMESYYDLNKADQFDEIFGGTYIGQHPTPKRNQYAILRFNFSKVDPRVEYLEESFHEQVQQAIQMFFRKYESHFDTTQIQQILQFNLLSSQLTALFEHAGANGLKIYVLIDEYDNFANTLLSISGNHAYQKLTHGDGMLRHFFNVFKGGATGSESGLAKLFITGVSPVTMDDVTSGMNIGFNISRESSINDMVGFTKEEVQTMLEFYNEKAELNLDISLCLELMETWYNGYVFSDGTEHTLFNTDMVLYFVNKTLMAKKIPNYLVDHNIRIDYGKLRHLILVDKQLNGNFERLKQVVEDSFTTSQLVQSFPLEELKRPQNFVSLLYYFGLLTQQGTYEGLPKLVIPNETVKQLIFDYLRKALNDVGVFKLDTQALMDRIRVMAYRGDWKVVFEFLAEQIQAQSSVRDFINGEKFCQTFLMIYLDMIDFYLVRSELEASKGYSDLFLCPNLNGFPDMPYSYLIECKYITRSPKAKKLPSAKLKEALVDAKKQLTQYQKDPFVKKSIGTTQLISLVVVFHGWELAHFEAV